MQESFIVDRNNTLIPTHIDTHTTSNGGSNLQGLITTTLLCSILHSFLSTTCSLGFTSPQTSESIRNSHPSIASARASKSTTTPGTLSQRHEHVKRVKPRDKGRQNTPGAGEHSPPKSNKSLPQVLH